MIEARTLSPFTFCPSFDSCNAPICPLDPEKHLRVKLEEEASCNARLESRLAIARRFGIKPYEVLLAKEKQRYNQPDCLDFRDYVENYGISASGLKPIEQKIEVDIEYSENGIEIQNGGKLACGKKSNIRNDTPTPTIKSIPKSLIDKSIKTIAIYSTSHGFSKRDAYIIAIRVKLRSGAVIDPVAVNIEESYKIGSEKLHEYITRAKLFPGDIPELKTNFPIFYRKYCQEKDTPILKSEVQSNQYSVELIQSNHMPFPGTLTQPNSPKEEQQKYQKVLDYDT